MSSPIHRQVLTPKKPIWVFRLEHKIAAQDERIKILEDALEDATIENKKLRESIPVPSTTGQSEGSPQFKMSL
jgi:hypothetical protein